MFDFTNIYHCYILGLLWGDGYVCKYKHRNNYYSLRLETEKQDSIQYEEIFNLANIHYSKNSRSRPNRKEQQTINISSTEIFNFVTKYKMDEKSFISPDLMLLEIPIENHHYWFRGFFDADGCLYSKGSCTQLYFSGSYTQDWNFIEIMYKNLNINYKIQRIEGSKSSYSCIRLTNRLNITKTLNYLYNGIMFGLSRKHNKFLNLLEKPHHNPYKKINIEEMNNLIKTMN